MHFLLSLVYSVSSIWVTREIQGRTFFYVYIIHLYSKALTAYPFRKTSDSKFNEKEKEEIIVLLLEREKEE